MVTHLHAAHDPLIVLLSLLVAVISSLVSLDVAERLRGARGRAWGLWLAGASGTLGGGIWSMHFIGMLAFQPPFEVRYDVDLTVASLFFAIVSTAIGYAVVAWDKSRRLGRLALAGLVTGLGVAAMHYTGMAALMAPVEMRHDARLVAVSVLIAVAAATAAFWLSLRIDKTWHKLAASLAMGAAIAGMHYTAMAALSFDASADAEMPLSVGGTPKSIMAAALAIATILILSIGFMAAISDRRFDLRARREAERQLRTERRFETVVSASSSSSIVFLVDEDGRITFELPSASRVLGHGAGTLLGTLLKDLVSPEKKLQFEGLMQEILAHPGSVAECELQILTAQGGELHVEMAVNNLLADPHLRSLVVKLHDVTERNRITAELRRAKEIAEAGSRAKSTFLANISHELRTPLNAIIGFSDLLLAQPNGPLQREYLEFAKDINAGGKALLHLINRTLEYTRAETGSLGLEAIPLDPMLEATELARLFEMQLQAKSLSLVVEPFNSRFKLIADQDKFRQILTHLISNAVKFTPKGGRILVSAEVDVTGSLLVAVQDNGRGMTHEQIAQAPLPFGKGNSGLNRDFEGVGLGLATCNALAAMHEARIIIESARGVGTLVAIKFPASRVSVKPDQPKDVGRAAQ